MTVYFITNREYVGPNQAEHADADYYLIQTAPPRTNQSGQIRTEGWLGTTNDWAEYARGQFDTRELAEARIAELLPDGYRTMEPTYYDCYSEDDGGRGAIVMFKPGKYAPCTRSETESFCWEAVQADVTAATTDDEITAMVAEWQDACREHWQAELDEDAARSFAERRRQELRDEAESEAGDGR